MKFQFVVPGDVVTYQSRYIVDGVWRKDPKISLWIIIEIKWVEKRGEKICMIVYDGEKFIDGYMISTVCMKKVLS